MYIVHCTKYIYVHMKQMGLFYEMPCVKRLCRHYRRAGICKNLMIGHIGAVKKNVPSGQICFGREGGVVEILARNRKCIFFEVGGNFLKDSRFKNLHLFFPLRMHFYWTAPHRFLSHERPVVLSPLLMQCSVLVLWLGGI